MCLSPLLAADGAVGERAATAGAFVCAFRGGKRGGQQTARAAGVQSTVGHQEVAAPMVACAAFRSA
jgi:hypothetical protein